MPLVRGATAAGFTIVRLLGCGQIGELYLVENPRLPRRHALKILSPDVSADPEYRYRFTQESDRAAALWHPNIVGLYDRGEIEDQLWVSMDFVDGIDTAQLLTDTYPDGMPPDMVLEIVSAIGDALDYAHDQGITHRYVNPSNILVTDPEAGRRRILLTGFGVTRRPNDTNSLTRAKLAIGTISYTAPEQLMDDSIDGRTDQYALACTAFHLLTGSPAFAHMNPAVVSSKQLNELPPRPGDVKPELTYFDAPFARALKKNPAERFPRCREFAKALESKVRLGPYIPSPAATALLNTAAGEASAPTQPPARPPRAAEVPDPPTEVVPAPRPAKVPVPSAAKPAGSPNGLQRNKSDDELAKSGIGTAAAADTGPASRHRRLLHIGGLGLAIATVAAGGILGVMALRSASGSGEAPADVDPPSPMTSVPSARPEPAKATLPPPVVTAPATLPPPVVKSPAPVRTTPPMHTPSPATTTTSPVHSHSPAATTAPRTTTSPSPTPTTTAPNGLDPRPAVGVPCGPAGTTATSNSGSPVVCVNTPGGSAWEPPGG